MTSESGSENDLRLVQQLSADLSEELSSDTDEEVDVEALLQAAEQAMAGNEHVVKKQKNKQVGHANLISKRDGVYKLNPDVLLAQSEKQVKAMSTEKAKLAGTDWFDFKTPEMTDEIKRDLQVLKMRSVLDPKRHYRKENTKTNQLPKNFQMGTIISDSTESTAHKIHRKDQKETIVQELLADMTRRDYFKRKTAEIDAKKRSGGRGFYKAVQGRRGSKFSKMGLKPMLDKAYND